MCGIAGWASFSQDLRPRQPIVDRMVATLRKRGPDAQTSWSCKNVVLGHSRLAIVDIKGGAQPMIYRGRDVQVSLSFSGEIYNFMELRAQLQQLGYDFATRSDTEVILVGYVHWGERLFERLNGMFAFAIWDERKSQLFLVRDRLGVKPLFFSIVESGMLFASEPKAIFASGLVEKVVDLRGLQEALSWSRTPGEAVWQGMQEVKPGFIVKYDKGGSKEIRYWSLAATPHTDSIEETVSKVRCLLQDIVEKQLVADVPTCTLLSGGLDSTAITALSQRCISSNKRVRSFALDFATVPGAFAPDRFRDAADGPFAELAADYIGTEHTSLVLDGKSIADPAVRRSVVEARDIPAGFGDADNSLYLLFSSIRKEATVALSGESADEVFGGYRWLHQVEAQNANNFPWIDFTYVTSPKTGLSVFTQEAREKLDLDVYTQERYREAITESPRLQGEGPLDSRMREICYLHLTRYLRILLDRKDRISMAVGLEVRVPFCDHRLVEYVFNTPWSMKVFDGREKSILRHAVTDLLPKPILERRKAPYPSTKDISYLSEIKGQAGSLAQNVNHGVFDFINRSRILEITNKPTTDVTPDERNGIERTLDLATWIEIHAPRIVWN